MITLNGISAGQLWTCLHEPGADRNGLAADVCLHAGLGRPDALRAGRVSSVAYATAIARWLGDVDDDAAGEVPTPIGPIRDRPCDGRTARLLRAAGVNPMALLLVEIALHGVGGGHSVQLDGTTVGYVSLGSDPDRVRPGVRDEAYVRIADGVWWGAGSLSISVDIIPATVVATAEGRALTDLDGHHAFEGLTVVSAEPTEIGTYTIRTDEAGDATTWRAALEAR